MITCEYYYPIGAGTQETQLDRANDVTYNISRVFAGIGGVYLICALVYMTAGIIYKVYIHSCV
jgi:hypothetical protein